MRQLLVLLAISFGAIPTALAFDQPSLRLDSELGYANFTNTRRYHGLEAGVDVSYTHGGFWVLRGGYTLGEHHSKDEAFRVHQVSVGLRYQLDVFHYVPWIELSPTYYLSALDDDAGPSQSPDYGAAFGVGIDWLVDPQWSVGFAGRYHQMLGESAFPAYTTAGLRIGYRWDLGDPFAP